MPVPVHPADTATTDDIRIIPDAPPDRAGLRMVAGARSVALLDERATVLWWCAPRPDSSPLFWRLLGPGGGAARWCGVLGAESDDRTVGATLATTITVRGGRFDVSDTVVDPSTLVRTISNASHPVRACLEVELTSFDARIGAWDRSRASIGSLPVRVEGADRLRADGASLHAEVDLLPGSTRRLAVTVGDPPGAPLAEAIRDREEQWDDVARRAHLPRDHAERAVDALRVLAACTFDPTGAVIAAPTTSLPEVPGGERNWDYRYCWLRDASIAASVASLLGRSRVGDQYLRFVCERTELGSGRDDPVVTVGGQVLPPERTIAVDTWSGAVPVRVGNEAADQAQLDAFGFLGEAAWTRRRCGGRVARSVHRLIGGLADAAAAGEPEPTNGIWELREPHRLTSAEVGRWLLLDRAIKLRRFRRPWLPAKARWKAARAAAAARILGAIEPHGWLPLALDGTLAEEPDATGLLAVIVGLLDPADERAHRLVDATVEALGEDVFLRRYRSTVDDGFAGVEGAFLPASWWVVSALAVLGRIEEAEDRADGLCRALPQLLPEEWDVAAGRPLGNLPLLWSHMEAARALYLLHAARVRRRWGRAGLGAWRAWRFLRPAPSGA